MTFSFWGTVADWHTVHHLQAKCAKYWQAIPNGGTGNDLALGAGKHTANQDIGVVR